MTQYSNLDELARRPLRNWTIDGLPELSMGALWIVWGGAILIGNALPQGSFANVYRMAIPFLLVASALSMNSLTKRLKSRITYPRTGYVALPDPTGTAQIATATIAGLAAAGLAALIAAGSTLAWENLIATGSAMLIALALVIGSIRTRAPHLLWLAAFSVVLGAALYVSGTGYEGLNWLLIGLGAVSMVLGAVRLRRFLREHPLTEDSQV